MATDTVAPHALEGLRRLLRGEVVDRDDPGYDDARRVFNGMIDRRPLAVARCADAADVATAIGWAREHGVRVAVRGGGHNELLQRQPEHRAAAGATVNLAAPSSRARCRQHCS
jgi:FAD/FMN-containing dehydrogenase